jgi:hypothetical protein
MLEMFRQQDNLAAMVGAMRNVAIDSLHDGMCLAANRHGAAQVRIGQGFERLKCAVPAIFPQLQQGFSGGRRLLKFTVAIAPRFFAIL